MCVCRDVRGSWAGSGLWAARLIPELAAHSAIIKYLNYHLKTKDSAPKNKKKCARASIFDTCFEPWQKGHVQVLSRTVMYCHVQCVTNRINVQTDKRTNSYLHYFPA